MPPEMSARPLLTIAIPTFNRAALLAELLAVLEPQLIAFSNVELLIADNCSDDDTPAVIAASRDRLAGANVRFTSFRHATNIGSDANFVSCFESARGHFFWLCGDDDILTPGALAQVMPHLQDANGAPAALDLVYATNYGFRQDYVRERQVDPLGRRFHTVRDAHDLALIVNIMFTYISGIIVNKDRLQSLPHEDPATFIGTNLVQLSWCLPLLLDHRKSVVLWQRPVAARQGHAHGYSLGHVFGERLAANVRRLLPERPDLQASILNTALRRWFPSVLLDVRSARNQDLQLEDAHRTLRHVFGANPRYWLFTYPALALPLSLAKPYTRATAAFSKLLYMLHLPRFWRKQT